MATVITLCLAAAGRERLPADHLRGDLFRGNYVRKDLDYTPEPALANAEQGRDNLDAGLHAFPGKKLVIGHWLDGQVISTWLRDIGPTSDIDPDDVMFVATGNPERKHGGIATVPAENMPANITMPALFSGPSVPDNTPYTVYDIAQQYEFWCDYPTGALNDTARANAIDGMSLHTDYSQVTVNDPKNVTYVEGNRRYILAPTYPLPMISRYPFG